MGEEEKVEKFKEALETQERTTEQTGKIEKDRDKHSRKKEVISYLLVVVPASLMLITGMLGVGSLTTQLILMLIGGISVILGPLALYLYWRKKKYGRVTLSKYRFTENIIPLGKKIYVLGTAVPSEEDYSEATQKGIVKKTKEHDMLTISDKSEEEITKSSRYLLKFILGGLGIIASVAGLLFIFMYAPMDEDIGRIILFLIFILITSIATFISGFKELKRQQVSESLPTSQVSSMAMGLVELKGKAKPIERKESPITGKKCSGYQLIVEQYVSSGRSGHWQVISKTNELPVFYLEDETGKVPIDPEGAEMLIDPEFRQKTKDLRELPEPAQDFLREGGVPEIEWKEDSPVGY